MPSNTTVVIGASRGIGLELAKFLAQNPDDRVIATMRKPFNFDQANIDVLELDQTNQKSVDMAAKKVAEADTLIVNGAIGEDELLTQISSDRLLHYLDTNVVGPHRVINAFLPALRARKTRKVIYISSTAASLTGQVGEQWGLRGPYATSKAAGNMLTIQFHNELHGEGFTVVAIHPGWVATDMGNIAGPGAMPATESVQKIMGIVNGLEKADGAKFFNIDGTILPW
jgi:NAD(P)-dependent dehydrogenase (short-subunit alcohol dehydrogenase family)